MAHRRLLSDSSYSAMTLLWRSGEISPIRGAAVSSVDGSMKAAACLPPPLDHGLRPALQGDLEPVHGEPRLRGFKLFPFFLCATVASPRSAR